MKYKLSASSVMSDAMKGNRQTRLGIISRMERLDVMRPMTDPDSNMVSGDQESTAEEDEKDEEAEEEEEEEEDEGDTVLTTEEILHEPISSRANALKTRPQNT